MALNRLSQQTCSLLQEKPLEVVCFFFWPEKLCGSTYKISWIRLRRAENDENTVYMFLH